MGKFAESQINCIFKEVEVSKYEDLVVSNRNETKNIGHISFVLCWLDKNHWLYIAYHLLPRLAERR